MCRFLILTACVIVISSNPCLAQGDNWDAEYENTEDAKQKRALKGYVPSNKVEPEFSPWMFAVSSCEGNLTFHLLGGVRTIGMTHRLINDTLWAMLSTIGDTAGRADTLFDTTDMYIQLAPHICERLGQPQDTVHLRLIVTENDSVRVEVVDSAWFLSIVHLQRLPPEIEVCLRFEETSKGDLKRHLNRLKKLDGYTIANLPLPGGFTIRTDSSCMVIYLKEIRLNRRTHAAVSSDGHPHVFLKREVGAAPPDQAFAGYRSAHLLVVSH